MAERGPCRECAGTGWACQPPRCHHPLHIACPWCLGSGKASTPQVIEQLQDALVAIQDIALPSCNEGRGAALLLSIESIARHALRESAWEPIIRDPSEASEASLRRIREHAERLATEREATEVSTTRDGDPSGRSGS